MQPTGIVTLGKKAGKKEFSLANLIKFIVEAKKTCYAGGGKEKKLRNGTKILTFQKGNFFYTDEYDGWYQAPGRETVTWKKQKGQRLWFMSYAGGMNPDVMRRRDEALTKHVFVFLKTVLGLVTKEKPYRGPETEDISNLSSKVLLYGHRTDRFGYYAKTHGDVLNFNGEEMICLLKKEEKDKHTTLFKQTYHGGLVIPKDGTFLRLTKMSKPIPR